MPIGTKLSSLQLLDEDDEAEAVPCCCFGRPGKSLMLSPMHHVIESNRKTTATSSRHCNLGLRGVGGFEVREGDGTKCTAKLPVGVFACVCV